MLDRKEHLRKQGLSEKAGTADLNLKESDRH